MVVKTSQVKALLKEKGYRTSKDVPEILEKHILSLLEAATLNAQGHGRSTIKAEDFPGAEG